LLFSFSKAEKDCWQWDIHSLLKNCLAISGVRTVKCLLVVPFGSDHVLNKQYNLFFLKVRRSVFNSTSLDKWINRESTKEQSSNSKEEFLRTKDDACWLVGLLLNIFLNIAHSLIRESEYPDKPVWIFTFVIDILWESEPLERIKSLWTDILTMILKLLIKIQNFSPFIAKISREFPQPAPKDQI
jgi:hypothetical protein